MTIPTVDASAHITHASDCMATTDRRLGQALLVFILAGLTDALDGLIARVFHQKKPTGGLS